MKGWLLKKLGYTDYGGIVAMKANYAFEDLIDYVVSNADAHELKASIRKHFTTYHLSKNPPRTAIPKPKKPRKVGITSRAQDC